MEELIKALAIARANEESATNTRKEYEEEYKTSPVFLSLKEKEKLAKEETAISEEALRVAGKSQYEIDKIKKPEHGAFAVDEETIVKFNDLPGLREWCFLNNRMAFDLNMGSLEKDAKGEKLPPQFATVDKEPKVKIKKDLSKFI